LPVKGLPQSNIFSLALDDDIIIISMRLSSFARTETTEFQTVLEDLRSRGYSKYVLDITACRFVSSEALGMIASCWKWCFDEGNGFLSVVLPSGEGSEVRNLFEITGLCRAIGAAIQPSRTDAINYIREFA
jgi:anti-anti-sigma regulatory factor